MKLACGLTVYWLYIFLSQHILSKNFMSGVILCIGEAQIKRESFFLVREKEIIKNNIENRVMCSITEVC